MANELFDKKIKEKLESVNRAVSPDVWENIRRKIYIPWYVDFWRKFGWPLYSTIATVLLLVNLKDKFTYEKQFRLLNDKISTIEQIKSQTQIQTIIHRDTVYINKTIYLVQRSDEKPPMASDITKQNPPIVLNNVEKPVESAIEPADTKPDEKSVVREEQAAQAETKEDKTENPAGKDSVSHVKDLKIPEKTSPPVPAAKKTFNWPRIDTRLGLNLGVGLNHTIDLGPTFEVFMGKSLSFSTGISIFSHPESEYYNPKEFNVKTRQDFANLYGAHLPPKFDRIEDIHIKASLITIPLNLNYYLPLNKRLDLKFSLGTNIDLRLYQNVKFESHIDGDEYYSTFDTEQKQSFWHNMSMGAGLQYHYKRYAFQLVPMYIYHYRETDFLSPKSNFRLNGSVLIDLKRR
jgi:hypothetical protein